MDGDLVERAGMNYISTRGGVEPIAFKDAVMMGLASDGGLLLPEQIPDVTAELGVWQHLGFCDLAFEVLSRFVGDIDPADLRTIIQRSYATFDHPAVVPVVAAGPSHVAELFHGPTLAFKDVALQFLGNVFDYILQERGGYLTVLGATSGDTGSAAIHGLRGKESVDIFILHPAGKTSPIQERQMTSVLDANVHNIAVAGSFDDCQSLVKGAFGDVVFKENYRLGAVNSVNWARIAAQIVYYFWAYFRVVGTAQRGVRFAVPTGNFGDIFAGYMAQRMGLPVEKLIVATNENSILDTFFSTGVYRRDEVCHTISPSMDIQVASNFERYLYYYLDGDSVRLREMMNLFAATGELAVECRNGQVDGLFTSAMIDTTATLEIIEKYYREYDYLLDPHTAVGVGAAQLCAGGGVPTICLATAHPAKFPAAIERAIGTDVARHPRLELLKELETRCSEMPNDSGCLREIVAARSRFC